MLFFRLPEDASDFRLVIGDHPAVEVSAPEEISDELWFYDLP